MLEQCCNYSKQRRNNVATLVEGGIETSGWPKGEFIPSWGGEVSGKKLMPDILHIKSQQTPTVIFFQATLSIFGHITSSKLPSSKN